MREHEGPVSGLHSDSKGTRTVLVYFIRSLACTVGARQYVSSILLAADLVNDDVPFLEPEKHHLK